MPLRSSSAARRSIFPHLSGKNRRSWRRTILLRTRPPEIGQMNSRTVALTASLVFVAASLTWSFTGCALGISGLPPENPGMACNNDAQCDDTNACTDETCTDGHCLSFTRNDGSDA